MTIDLSVTLSLPVLELAASPTTSVVCGTAGRGDNFAQDGEFRNYANGTTRLIVGTGTTRALPITLRALTPAQVDTVMSMVGKVVLFRDTYGRRVYGAFLTTATVDIPLSGLANTTLMTDITISLQEVDYDEAV